MPTPDQETWIRPFIAELGRLLGSDGNHRDAATLAKLRRGLTEYPAERDIWVYGHLRWAGPEHEEQANAQLIWSQLRKTSNSYRIRKHRKAVCFLD
jgi:hypothetical protein